jgi:hypothetical protein
MRPAARATAAESEVTSGTAKRVAGERNSENAAESQVALDPAEVR